MIWDDVCDSLEGTIRTRCPTRETTRGLLFDVPNRLGYPLHAAGARTRDAEDVRSWLADVALDLSEARPFAYENMSLDRTDGRLVYPECEADEYANFNEGLLPMPCPLAWFEYEGAGVRTGLLIKEVGNRLDLVEFSRNVVDGRVLIGVYPWVQQLYRGGVDSLPEGTECVHHGPSERPDRETRLILGLRDPLGLYEREKAWEAAVQGLDAGSPEADMMMQREACFLVYLLMMLGSRWTEKETSPPSKFVNRKRKERGLRLLPASTTVRVVPRGVADRIRAQGGDVHASHLTH